MTIVSLPRVKQNQPISGPTLINNVADALEAAVNGQLDDSNMGANAPIKVVATLSGESVRQGKVVLLQAGASRCLLVYDAGLGKWVSDVQRTMSQQSSITTTATSYTDIADANLGKIMVPNFKAFYDAGLRPQFQLGGMVDGPTGSVVTRFRVNVGEFADGDTAVASLGTSQELTHNSTTITYKFSDWTVATISAPTDAHALLTPQAMVDSAGTGAFLFLNYRMRWRST